MKIEFDTKDTTICEATSIIRLLISTYDYLVKDSTGTFCEVEDVYVDPKETEEAKDLIIIEINGELKK